MSRKTIVLLGVLLAIGVALSIPITRRTNCGGNSAALFYANEYALIASLAAENSSNETFSVTAMTPDQRKQFSYLASHHGISDARFLVSTEPLFYHKSQPRRIIIVCDTPFNNVPRRQIAWWIIPAPLTHAAGFSDGSVGLISPAQFATLNRSSFVFLDELYPTK